MDNLPDEALVEAAKIGDAGAERAFQELMHRHMRPIWSFARQYGKTEEDTEDIVQETFFKAWRYMKRFKTGLSFKPWLYTIARNTALDILKKRRAAAFSELSDADNDLAFEDTLEADEPLAHELFEREEIAAEVARALEALHPDHRAVLAMHYQDDLTFDEIAEILGRPMNTVKSWHRRALARLRPLFLHRQP